MASVSVPARWKRDCGGLWHPLDMVPFFRRFAPSHTRNIVYTFVWNLGFALFFSIFGLIFNPDAPIGRMLWVNCVIAMCVGYWIHTGYAIGNRVLGQRIHKATFARRTLYYAGIPILGVFAGYWLAFTILQWGTARRWVFSWQGIASILTVSLVVSSVLAAVLYVRERQARAGAAFEAERARVEAAEHQFHLAKLKLLEAQIEPHFLYNTLANVISLIDANPPRAKHMLEKLIEYLRSAAIRTQDGDISLGRQVELVTAYLDLIAVRMGSRLAFSIDVPHALGALPLPPMLLQPLVENAIKHGLEPKVEGGNVRIAARRSEDGLVLTVSDDGAGVAMSQAMGSTRLGLANLRDRLRSIYGARAQLVLEESTPGTVATITLPLGDNP
ncbi:MAG: histidine kinase [Pseudomonadota bacterium]|nr:histidine kinase [Pseudomonadota bacterium]